MREIAIIEKVYSVNDLKLPENAALKKKVLEIWRECQVDNEYWYDFTKETFETKLTNLGFYEITTKWSGFYFQGAGASFAGKISFEDALNLITDQKLYHDARILKKYDIDCLEIKSSGCYVHSNTMELYSGRFEYQGKESEHLKQKIVDILDKLHTAIIKTCREMADIYYSDLKSEYEYLTSDEYLMDYFYNDMAEFYEDGGMV